MPTPTFYAFYLRVAKHPHRSASVVVYLVSARNSAPTIVHAGRHRHCLRYQTAAQRILRWRHKPIHFIIWWKPLEFWVCFTTIPHFTDTRSFVCHTLAAMHTEGSRNSCYEEDSHDGTLIAIGPRRGPNASSTVKQIQQCSRSGLSLSGRPNLSVCLTPQPQPRLSGVFTNSGQRQVKIMCFCVLTVTCLRSRRAAMARIPGSAGGSLIHSPTLHLQLNPCIHTAQNAYCNNIYRDASHTGS
jgi:hypothetical protein